MKCEHDVHAGEDGDYKPNTPEATVYLCGACAQNGINWEDMLEAFPGLLPGNDDLDEPLEVNGADLVQWISLRALESGSTA